MSATTAFRRGTRVLVPWGLDEPREAVVVEVWGDPEAPSHIRVQLKPQSDDNEAALLLLKPSLVTIAA